MKKISAFLLLATHIVSTSCMERERPKIHHPVPQNIPVCEAYDTNEKYLDNIMNMTYKRDQTIAINEIELTPIYRPMHTNNTALTKKQCEKEETKPFLRTLIPVQPNTDIQQLYDNVFTVIKNLSTKTLITLITDMNDAKNKNIDEDVMGKYSYDKWLDKQEASEEKMVLFFGYLKRYNLTVNNTKELLPNNNELYKKKLTPKTNNQLAEILDLPSSANTSKTYYIYDHESVCHNYHAFYNLESYASMKPCNGLMKTFISYVYSNKEIPQNNYSQLSYADLKDKFYELASCLFTYIRHREYQEAVDSYQYDLIKIIEAAATSISKKQESDFGYDIIESDLMKTKKLYIFLSIIKLDDNPLHSQKRIGILCHLIKKYNNQRKNKITPTSNQCKAYNEFRYCNFNFALPDSCDNTLFNKEIYALDEFTELVNNIKILVWSSDENIQECIDHLYPPRK